MKLKLNPGQTITFGPFRIVSVTPSRLVAIGIRERIAFAGTAEAGSGFPVTLGYRQCLVFDGVGHLISDKQQEVTLEVLGPVERVKVNRGFYPKPATARSDSRREERPQE